MFKKTIKLAILAIISPILVLGITKAQVIE